jgi:GntR family transcriptional regulator / MocR family aminotransferase
MRLQGWAELYDWRIDRADPTPLFRQIYLQIRTAVLAQHLRPGSRLPSTRALAERLGVARASVVAAFEQLLAEGYLTGKVGAGTFIAADLPQPFDRGPAPPPRSAAKPAATRMPSAAHDYVLDPAGTIGDRPFNTGRSLIDARSVETWRRISNRAFRTFGPIHLGYTDTRGLAELRQAVCDYLRAARAVQCDPEQILITAGTQQAIDLTIRVLLAPGDSVWVEDPGYTMTYGALLAARVRPRPVPVDGHGLDVSAGLRIAPKARAAFVTPSHQFPLGVVLSMPRRLELLAWARRSRSWIVEDDYHSEFQYSGRPLASLQGLDEAERVIYVGTLNKVLFPGLRMGYVVVPCPLLAAFTAVRYLADRQPSTLHQTVVAEFMRDGYLAAHIRRMRLMYREQRDVLVAALNRHLGDRLDVVAPVQGMHLAAFLRHGRNDVALADAARKQGVVVRPLSPLYHRAKPRPGLMFGFGGYPKQVIPSAVVRLTRALA